MPGWRTVALGAVLAAYALGSYLLMARAPAHLWTVATLFGPMLVGLALFGLQRRHLPTLLLAAGAALGLVLLVLQGGATNLQRLYVLQHAAIHGALAWSFGITLRPGAVPLISALAQRVHGGSITPAMAAYTRRLTGVWVAFFCAMVAVSLPLYAWAPWPWWSLFCGVLSPLAAVALFVVEYLVRYRRHPEFERATMAQAMRAFSTRPAQAR